MQRPAPDLTLDALRAWLRDQVLFEIRRHFDPHPDPRFVDAVTANWFEDQRNYDGRWAVIEQRRPGGTGRVLDLAAGCGTFVLHGLHRGHEVRGVEPEPWKLAYYERKVSLAGYPSRYRGRVIRAVGERLPFASASFDLVTSYQTIEHVQDVGACLHEMLRVLRPGGGLYLRAPDYDSFFEPHYRVPFLPRMNRTLARQYLRLLGRPTSGLDTLQWVTRRQVEALLRQSGHTLTCEPIVPVGMDERVQLLIRRRPVLRAAPALARALLTQVDRLRRARIRVRQLGRVEDTINLWIEKR